MSYGHCLVCGEGTTSKLCRPHADAWYGSHELDRHRTHTGLPVALAVNKTAFADFVRRLRAEEANGTVDNPKQS